MATLDDLRSLLTDDHGFAVVSTASRDGRVLSSVVNAGITTHPASGDEVIGFVSLGGAGRLQHIRRGAPVTVTARSGWRWASATGSAELVGPDDPADGFDEEAIRLLLRRVFEAAGGTHDDWDEYDRAMRDDRRIAVFVRPDRILGNG